MQPDWTYPSSTCQRQARPSTVIPADRAAGRGLAWRPAPVDSRSDGLRRGPRHTPIPYRGLAPLRPRCDEGGLVRVANPYRPGRPLEARSPQVRPSRTPVPPRCPPSRCLLRWLLGIIASGTSAAYSGHGPSGAKRPVASARPTITRGPLSARRRASALLPSSEPSPLPAGRRLARARVRADDLCAWA